MTAAALIVMPALAIAKRRTGQALGTRPSRPLDHPPNLGWAFGYNLLLVPLAAAGISPPVLAALAMTTSSVTVVGNALRLCRFGNTSAHRGGPPRHGLVTPVAQPPAGMPASS